ncbi:hypothetical protein [Bifidobacterium xylocopae]|uniref:Uncharacterized protein n=1 Tax=Bifidobacterium xylocopae TaxID=2493119 RepID=A0A366KEH7_9BIFI|nr:hypothetical protein [Bifidobacterium xylocopae]RBP99979.1 hypothetical protein CRD59_00480 [Bifidobacterium xylocopae]
MTEPDNSAPKAATAQTPADEGQRGVDGPDGERLLESFPQLRGLDDLPLDRQVEVFRTVLSELRGRLDGNDE